MSKKALAGSELKDYFRRYVFRYIDSNMYVLIENQEALIIDPHIDVNADKYLKECGVKKVTILLTHEHFDHTCGIPWFRANYNSYIICQRQAIEKSVQRYAGRPISVSIVLLDQGREQDVKELEREYPQFTFTADMTFDDKVCFFWHHHEIVMEHIPGHSPASTLIIFDKDIVFSGDSLIPDCEPTLRWPGSNREQYQGTVVPRLMSLPSKCMVLPGHGESFEMGRATYSEGIWKVER